MSVRFAGSRSLDERRRRRLAVEHENSGEPHQQPAAPKLPIEAFIQEEAKPAEVKDRPRERLDVPYRKLVSPRVGKHLLVSAFVLCVGATIQFASIYHTDLGPLSALFTDSGVLIWRYFCCSVLMLTAQLTMLVWWVRSTNPSDFDGKYRIWIWVAAGWIVFAAASATDAHRGFSYGVQQVSQFAFYRDDLLSWLFPSLVMGGVLTTIIHKEIRRDPATCVACYFAICGFIATSISLYVQLSGLATVTYMLALTMSLLCMSLYARYVIYVTADPP